MTVSVTTTLQGFKTLEGLPGLKGKSACVWFWGDSGWNNDPVLFQGSRSINSYRPTIGNTEPSYCYLLLRPFQGFVRKHFASRWAAPIVRLSRPFRPFRAVQPDLEKNLVNSPEKGDIKEPQLLFQYYLLLVG